MNPHISRYKHNLAAYLYGKPASTLSETEKQHVYKLFKRINPVYHEDLSYYPYWLHRNFDEVVSDRDKRRMQAKDTPPYFLFSVPRIVNYLTDTTLPD
jgi:hypothetical protein